MYYPHESCASMASPIGRGDYSTLVSNTPAAERANSIFWPPGDQGRQPRAVPCFLESALSSDRATGNNALFALIGSLVRFGKGSIVDAAQHAPPQVLNIWSGGMAGVFTPWRMEYMFYADAFSCAQDCPMAPVRK